MRKTLTNALRFTTAVGALAGATALATAPATASPAPKVKVAAPASSQPRPGTFMLHYRRVPLSSIPAASRAAIAGAQPKAAAQPNASVYVAEIVNQQYGMCVDANNYGPTAGQDGDTVQLWGCFNDSIRHANQWWLPAQTTSGYTELVNLQYGKCLDADDSQGFVDGAKVQLWSCFHDSVNHPNQWWNYGPPSNYTVLPLLWGGGAKVLDANNYGPSAGQNGDKIQIWQYLGGSNQIWLQ
jgi:hypothetical protein